MEDKFSLNSAKIILTAIFLSIYVIGASVQAFYVNTDIDQADQEDYLSRAMSLKTDLFKNMSDGNRMPLYPYLLSFLYHPGMSMEEYFRRGKIFNIILSILLLFALYLILRRYLEGPESKILLLIIGFTVFMPRAGYVQCELPFYFLVFCAFILYWRGLERPSWWVAASAGVLAGLSYLTKGSALPAVVWFIGCYLIFNITVPIIKNISDYSKKREILPQRHILRNIVLLVVFILIFLVTVSPYISVNKRVFGQYFYNVNSTFYIWYDSWKEVQEGTRAHGDRAGWPAMPRQEIPSAEKYLREHTFSQIAGRLGGGFIFITTNALGGFGYAQYFCIYFFICIWAIVKKYEAFRAYLNRDNHWAVAISLVLYFSFYFLLYIFGAAIFKGPRHPLAQYIPALFVMFYFLSRFGFSHYSQKLKCQFNTREVHIAVFCLLVLDLAFQMPYKLYKVFLGW